MKRKFLFAVLFFLAIAPAMSDTECPIGYGYGTYTQLEYIKSTGTQYIDIGIDANVASNTLLTTVLDFQATSTSNDHWVFGGYPGTNNGNYLVGSYGGNCVGLYQSKFYRSGAFDTSRHTVIVNSPEGSFWDGIKIGDPIYNESNTPNPLFLMASNHEGSANKLPCKIFSCKMSLDNRPVRDFVPVRRELDGDIGLYDKVEGKFYGNDGAGQFIAGPRTGESIFTDYDVCAPCPPNTYKDFVGGAECTPCPGPLVSPQGSTSVNDCGNVLWVGDKIFFMSSTPRTTHTLNVMDSNGNIFYGNLYSEQ